MDYGNSATVCDLRLVKDEKKHRDSPKPRSIAVARQKRMKMDANNMALHLRKKPRCVQPHPVHGLPNKVRRYYVMLLKVKCSLQIMLDR